MSAGPKYQLRLKLKDEFAQVAYSNPSDPALQPMMDVLAKHGADIRCQLNEFAAYVKEADDAFATAKDEAELQALKKAYFLYQWTKDTIEKPEMIKKHTKSWTVFVNDQHLYDETVADKIAADMKPLVGKLLTGIAKHDDVPAHNPQMPPRYTS